MMFFSIDEFDSPDAPGSGRKMKASTLALLDRCRQLAGIPFVVNSGYRTAWHNRRVRGVNGSAHTKGYAVDLRCMGSSERFKIINSALKVGFNRIGVGQTFIHLDNDPTKPKHSIWTYNK